jgi:hypothetical protein
MSVLASPMEMTSRSRLVTPWANASARPGEESLMSCPMITAGEGVEVSERPTSSAKAAPMSRTTAELSCSPTMPRMS